MSDIELKEEMSVTSPVTSNAQETKPVTPKSTKASKVKKAKDSRKPTAKVNAARWSPRPFPADTLENAIKIPRVIKDFNGGNPWPPTEVATALSTKYATNPFYYLTASARDYGLTIGTRETAQIELTDLGRHIVYATSPDSERDAIKSAFFNVQVFKAVFEHYQGQALPDLKYLQNTLESVFKISPKYHADFVRVYTANLKFLEQYGLEESEDADQQKVGKAQTTAKSVVVGEPASRTDKVAFVAMPFTEKTEKYAKGFFNEVLVNLITPAAVEAGFRVETAKRDGSDVIHSTIVNDLLNADLVIVDLTDHNPNVLFELGLRMAIEKPIALIKAKGTPAIFDVDNLLRVIDYDPNLWKSTIEYDIPRLANHIKGSWDNRDKNKTYMQILRQAG